MKRVMNEKPEAESDQQPEDAPPEYVVDDDNSADTRKEAHENPGTPGDEGQATGNPANAG